MLAPVFNKVGEPLTIERVPDLEPAPGQVVVKVARCGICGTDLHLTEGHGIEIPAGSILGHEYSGEVVAIGKGVERLKVGDRAVSLPVIGCGKCRECLSGRPASCPNWMMLWGGYAEYALMGEDTAIPLPGSLSMADAALAEPLAVALHGVEQARFRAGDTVIIQGAGPIGLSALFWARRMGAKRVDVIEGVPGRAAIALAMGADTVRAPDREGEGEPLVADVVIEAVGRPGLLARSIEMVRRGGTVVSLGNCFVADSFVPGDAARREVRMIFPQMYTQREFEHCVDVLARGAVEPRHMVTRTIGYGELPSVFESLRRSPEDCKVLIDPAAG
jgi:(R,R)-butanediol dehydrogenase/meso-butanediol dehydrogenase/diacetyl reductase